MILELLSALARAQEAPPAAEPAPPPPAEAPPEPEAPPPATDPADDDPTDDLLPYRVPFDLLADRTIGTTSRPVEFDWRDTKVQFGPTGAFLVELNTFNSGRGGAVVRLPSGGTLFEFGLSGVAVWDSAASELVALTPYRQPGRPPRLDLDLGVSVPLAEGVVTVAPKWFPAVELVFDFYGGLRYSVWPTAFRGLTFGKAMGAIFAPSLSRREVDNLEDARLDAMAVDRGRYGLVAGIGNELYFKPGWYLSPRAVVAIPVLAGASQTKLLFWADFSLSVGVALR